jgi:Tlde1 domain
MSYAIDTFGDISSFVVVPPPPRRNFRFVALGLTALGCGTLAIGLVAAAMAATWLALQSFGSAPDIRANAPVATKSVALTKPPPAAADVLLDVTPPPTTAPNTMAPLPAAAPSIVPPPVAPRMASLSPSMAMPWDAPVPPVAAKLAWAPLGATPSSSVSPPTSKAESLPPDAITPDAVPLPPRRPAGFTQSLPAPPAEAARATAAELSPLERDHDVARPAPGETTVQPTVASEPSAAAPAQPDNRSIFQRIFGAFSQPSGPGAGTAVYDIAAHTVYMPNGEKLEAHSGLGSNLDDPRSISQKNRGVIPPQTYALQPREQLFHGVAALRLNPVGDGDMYGRVGMLAHSYMLGPRGDSNGCVSFKDYDKFLAAYQRGEISRLIVVTHGGAAPSSVASLVRD